MFQCSIFYYHDIIWCHDEEKPLKFEIRISRDWSHFGTLLDLHFECESVFSLTLKNCVVVWVLRCERGPIRSVRYLALGYLRDRKVIITYLVNYDCTL